MTYKSLTAPALWMPCLVAPDLDHPLDPVRIASATIHPEKNTVC
jgi:hypothetical protein